MADDNKAKTVDESAEPGGVAPATEWTASDARGPLNAAGDPMPTAAEPLPETHVSDPAHVPPLSDEAPSTTAHEPVQPQGVAAAPTAPRRSLWPVAAGIIVGAIIGAGSAAAYYATQGGDTSQIAALSARLDAVEKRPDPRAEISALKTSVADLDNKVASAQKAVDAEAQARQAAPQPVQKEAAKPAFDPGPLQQKLADVQTGLEAVQKQNADIKGVDAKVAALAATLATLRGVDGKVATLQSGFDDMQKQSSTTQASLDTLRTNQKALEGKVTTPALAVVADSLVTQIARGEPYATQVEALSSIGADPANVAILKENADKGVPSAKSLAAKFDPLADPIIASEPRDAGHGGFVDKLKSGMFSMVSVRRADETTGDTLASHVALIQADLAHDDVADAFKVWTALPASAKAKSEAWGALAKTHAEAMQAARALQTQAITALGAKKS